MNSKELMKKIDIGRVGNGSVSYNDMCLILNKEEALELLQYIEKLEKENQELKEKNKKWQNLFGCDLCDALGREILLEENTKLKKAINLLKEHFELFYNKYNDTYEIKANLPLSTIISKVTYELLKSVLGEE